MPPNQEEKGIYNDLDIQIRISVEKNPRILRGGTFEIYRAIVRSADRYGYAPSNRTTAGFRPSRTYR